MKNEKMENGFSMIDSLVEMDYRIKVVAEINILAYIENVEILNTEKIIYILLKVVLNR